MQSIAASDHLQDSSSTRSRTIYYTHHLSPLSLSVCSLVEGETEEKPADPSAGDKQSKSFLLVRSLNFSYHKNSYHMILCQINNYSCIPAEVEEGSQNQLASSSSLARLAQIAAATSSRSRLTQSRSKLASHSKTTVAKTTVATSQTTVATSSKTTMATSRTTVAKSDTKVAKSDTKVTESEKKVVESGAKGTESKTKMTDSKISVSKSKMTTSKATMVESKAKVAESKTKVSPSKSRPTEEVGELGGAESAEAASSQSQMRGEKSASSEDTQ